jgi:hypothetical protein
VVKIAPSCGYSKKLEPAFTAEFSFLFKQNFSDDRSEWIPRRSVTDREQALIVAKLSSPYAQPFRRYRGPKIGY